MAERFMFKGFYVRLNDDGTGTVQRGDDSLWNFKYDSKGNTEVVSYTGHKPTLAQQVKDHIQYRVSGHTSKDRPDRRYRAY